MAEKRGTVRFQFLADVRDLLRGVKKAENEIGGMAKRSSNVFNKAFSKITSSLAGRFGTVGEEAAASLNGLASSGVAAMGTIGTAAAAGAAAAGAAFVGFAAKGIAAFQGLASEIRGMERATGADAETSSRLVATLNALHIETSAGQRAFFLLSKTIDSNSKKLTDHGIQIAKNKDGSVDLYQTLLNVRTAYQAAGQGAEGNAIAAAAFGKSGQALLPVLGATADRLKEIDDAAKRHHEMLSQKDIDKAKQLGIATTELHDAVTGLEVEIGSAFVPAATAGAKALEQFIHAADNIGGVISKIGKPFGGFGRFVGGFLKDAFQEYSIPLDILRGHFKGAVVDAIPLGNTIRNLFTRHKETAKAAEENAQAEADFADTIAHNASQALETYNQLLDDTLGAHLKAADAEASSGDALQKLADDYKGVDESASSATGKVYTFQDAMHDQFDSLVSANEAALDYADSVDALNTALHGTAQGSEDAAQAMDRLTHGGKQASDPRAIKRATDAAVQAAAREVEAMVESGQIADTAAARKAALHDKLVDLEKQFPEVAGAIKEYDDRLEKIPNLTTNAETATKKLSTAKKNLAEDIRNVISKTKDEIDAMKLTGTPLDQAYTRHFKLLEVLNYLKVAYPTLSGIIDTFLTDVEKSWMDFLGSPAAAPAIAGSVAPGGFGLGGDNAPPPVAKPETPNENNTDMVPGHYVTDENGFVTWVPPTPVSSGSASSGSSRGYRPTAAPVTVNQTIIGSGLDAQGVADLTAKRFQRAVTGARVG